MDDLVAAHDRVVDRVPDVGERGPEGHRALLQAFAGRGDARLRGVVDELGREELIEEPEVAGVQDLERDPLGGALDVCDH